MFLPCDTPFVSAELMNHLLKQTAPRRALFALHHSKAGFPFIIPVEKRELVQAQIKKGELSLQRLAQRLGAVRLKLPPRFSSELVNVNTPANYARARKVWQQKHF
jgi:molybdopterin-guanine dinucleotide biosynthesis protein A